MDSAVLNNNTESSNQVFEKCMEEYPLILDERTKELIDKLNSIITGYCVSTRSMRDEVKKFLKKYVIKK